MLQQQSDDDKAGLVVLTLMQAGHGYAVVPLWSCRAKDYSEAVILDQTERDNSEALPFQILSLFEKALVKINLLHC